MFRPSMMTAFAYGLSVLATLLLLPADGLMRLSGCPIRKGV
jgi:hypothetical protein